VLPATTFLETYDIADGYGAYSMQLVKPVVDVVGASRSNVEVFGELAARLGLAPGDESDAETMLRVIANLPQSQRDALSSDAVAAPAAGTTPVQFVDVFPRTPDGKAHLHPESLAAEAPEGLYVYRADPATADHPLALISPASEKTISSTLGELRTRPASVVMHPDDAGARGIEEGDTVRVFNALGEVHCPVHLTDAVAAGTVSLPKGLWRQSTFNRQTANALAPDTLTDLGAGACFNDARVEVARMVSASLGDRELSVWVAERPPGDPAQAH